MSVIGAFIVFRYNRHKEVVYVSCFGAEVIIDSKP